MTPKEKELRRQYGMAKQELAWQLSHKPGLDRYQEVRLGRTLEEYLRLLRELCRPEYRPWPTETP